MRKIKFRLWDKEKKIMLNVRSIDFEDCYFDTGGMYIDTIEGLDYWNSELYSLMQYTGLHDKKRKRNLRGRYSIYKRRYRTIRHKRKS